MTLTFEMITLLYLAVPWLIFSLTWLKFPVGLTLFATLLYALYRLWSRLTVGIRKKTEEKNLPRSTLLVLLMVATLWVALSGAGGMGFQNSDWVKHNAILKDLTTHTWPIKYEFYDRHHAGDLIATHHLVYYLAYYLPAGILGKLFGWKAAHCGLFLETWIGVVLALFWFMTLVKPGSKIAICIFPFFGGMDWLGTLLTRGTPPWFSEHIEWWARFGQYSSNTTSLFWVPQHAIPAWLFASLILWHWPKLWSQDTKRLPAMGFLGFLTGLCTLWSPFVSIGLVVLGGLFLMFRKLKGIATFENIFMGLALTGVVAFFFASRIQDDIHGWLWSFRFFQKAGSILLLFYLVEFGFYALFCKTICSPKTREEKILAWGTVITLLLLPAYKMGHDNDFLMRASLPALFILWIFLARQLLTRSWNATSTVLTLLLLIGAVTGEQEIVRSLTRGKWRVPPFEKTQSLQKLAYSKHYFTSYTYQKYIGTSESFFFHHLAP